MSIEIIDQHQLVPSKWIKEYWIPFQIKDVSFICPNFGLNVSFIQDSSSNFSRGSCLKDTAGAGAAWIVSAGMLPLPTASFEQQAPRPKSMSGPVYRTLVRIQTLHTPVSLEHRSDPWIHLAMVFVHFFHKLNVPTNPTRVSWHAQMHTIQNIPLRSLRSSREMASESLVLISSQMALKPLMSMMPQLLDLDTDSTGKPNIETLMPNQCSKDVVSPWFFPTQWPMCIPISLFCFLFQGCFHHKYMS